MYKAVEMIFSSDIEGILTPIRFRVQVDDELIVVPVKHPVIRDENKIPGSHIIDYRADFVINNQLRPGKLRFSGRDHIWSVDI